MLNIQTVSDLSVMSGICCILHSPSGFGKTYSIRTIPDPETVLVISTEDGLLTIRKSCPEMSAIKITNISELRELYEAFLNKDDSVAHFRTIVLDSLTEIAEALLLEEKTSNKDARQAYGHTETKIFRMINSFRSLDLNCLFFCHQEKLQDDKSRIFYSPSIPGKKAASKLTYKPDFIFALRLKETQSDGETITKRAFQTGVTDEMYYCKSRGDYLDTFEPPDWSIIFKKINENQ